MCIFNWSNFTAGFFMWKKCFTSGRHENTVESRYNESQYNKMSQYNKVPLLTILPNYYIKSLNIMKNLCIMNFILLTNYFIILRFHCTLALGKSGQERNGRKKKEQKRTFGNVEHLGRNGNRHNSLWIRRTQQQQQQQHLSKGTLFFF